ncbi:hypothetical protein [Halarchaeum sp. P4]|uniref:hypothetical protein n=1 Tax=Halarchaeum sp. P4 TaxID=3421639 RepID=UPI003EBEE5C9
MSAWNWRPVANVPTTDTLYGVYAGQAGAYAVGENGVVLRRDGKTWRSLVSGGPTGNGHTLRGVDASDDSTELWVVGGSGTVGVHDVEAGVTTALTVPNEEANFTDVAVEGAGGAADVWIADDSGRVHYSAPASLADRTWRTDEPGGGAGLTSVTVGPGGVVVTDTDGRAYRPAETGWGRLGVAAEDPLHCAVRANGVWFGSDDAVYAPDADGATWDAEPAAEDSVTGLAASEGTLVGVTEDGVAVARERGVWRTLELPVDEPLHAVAHDGRFVAVGESGTILEAE